MNDWLVIGIIGVGTFLIRFFPVFSGKFFDRNPELLEGMKTLPCLIFAALVAPSFLNFSHAQGAPLDKALLIAGVLTVVIARTKKSVLLATGAGLGSYLVLLQIF